MSPDDSGALPDLGGSAESAGSVGSNGSDGSAEPAEPAGSNGSGGQRVTWAELFFDLAWVFAVTQIATAFEHAHGPVDVIDTVTLLVLLWWCWVGAAMIDNAAGDGLDRLRSRALLFGMSGCGLVMAAAVPRAYDGAAGAWGFAVPYLLMRATLWWENRRSGRFAGFVWNPFLLSFVGSGGLVAVGALLPGGWRTAAWAVAAVIAMAGPALAPRRVRSTLVWDVEHLPERFGLFVIIALGETVVATGAEASAVGLEGITLVGLLIGLVLIVCLWWTYFHYGASAVSYALRSSPDRARIVRDVFSYGHIGFVLGIIGVAVGLRELLAHPYDQPERLAQLLLAPGAALYVGTFLYTRTRMFGGPMLPRTIATGVLVVVAVVAPWLPLLATAIAVTALLVALNAVEAWVVETGRQAPVVRLPWRRAEI